MSPLEDAIVVLATAHSQLRAVRDAYRDEAAKATDKAVASVFTATIEPLEQALAALGLAPARSLGYGQPTTPTPTSPPERGAVA